MATERETVTLCQCPACGKLKTYEEEMGNGVPLVCDCGKSDVVPATFTRLSPGERVVPERTIRDAIEAMGEASFTAENAVQLRGAMEILRRYLPAGPEVKG